MAQSAFFCENPEAETGEKILERLRLNPEYYIIALCENFVLNNPFSIFGIESRHKSARRSVLSAVFSSGYTAS